MWRRWCASQNVPELRRLTGRADLHLHSTASDGLFTPAQVVERARDMGLSVIALTDHDTMGGVAEFQSAAAAFGISALAGAEIAAEIAGDEVHLLCYFEKPAVGRFRDLLGELSEERLRRAKAMLARAHAAGYAIDAKSVLQNPQVGRPHLARELVRLGVANSVKDAFDRHLVAGGPIHVDRARPAASDVITLAAAAGGVVSLGHPCRYRHDHLEELAHMGITAVEVAHPSAGPSDRQRLRAAARRFGLLRTGGSDFHGHHPGETVGAASVGPLDAQRLMRKLATLS